MFKTILIPSLFLIAMATTAQAQVFEEKLDWAKKLSLKSATAKDAVKEKNLAGQKKFEMERKFPECAGLAKKNLTAFPALKGWIYKSWLKCVRNDKNEKKDILAVLKSLDAEKSNLLNAGPWKSGIWAELIPLRIQWLDQSAKKEQTEAWKQIDILLEQRERLDKAQKAKIYQIAAEISQSKAQSGAALFYYQASLVEQDNRAVRDKMKSLQFAMSEAPGIEPAVEVSKAESETTVVTTEEEQFEERFKSSSKANDLISVMEDCWSYLDKFPNGRRAKWAQDRMLEIYLSFDSGKDMEAPREKALGIMLKADPTRIVEWAKQLHRRADHRGSLKLAERALESLTKSASSGVLLYIAGRSSELLGEYKSAQKYFERFVAGQTGAEEYPEVLFRLGLTHLRLQQASSAIAVFEKLLLVKNRDKFELSARYWLTRSLQATNNVRALIEADTILAKYPFSYYGLRLRIERSAGQLEWPKGLKNERDLKASFFMLNSSKEAWNRVSVLARNGWNQEASTEAAEIPSPFDADSKVLYAKALVEAQIFPPAIRLVNEAVDINSDLGTLDIISLSLPLIFKEPIDAQAQKRKMSPLLVRSLIRQESAFGSRATSTSSAMGLMQMIPPTAEEIANDLGLKDISIPDDMYRPEINIQMGTYYLAKMLKTFNNNVPLALAAYNAGPQRMTKFIQDRAQVQEILNKPSSDPWDELWFDELPWFETSFYVKAILRNTLLYRLLEASGNKNPDERRVKISSVLWSDLIVP